MRGMRLIIGLFVAGVAVSSVNACSRNSGYAAGDVVPSNMIGVHVQNDNFLDVDVFAISEGLATRLGTVTGTSSQNFVIDPSLAAQDLRIVATPIGGNGRASTGSLTVGPGQTIDFHVGSTLRNSSVIIR
jgi:hypothetical protein